MYEFCTYIGADLHKPFRGTKFDRRPCFKKDDSKGRGSNDTRNQTETKQEGFEERESAMYTVGDHIDDVLRYYILARLNIQKSDEAYLKRDELDRRRFEPT
jgi:hypothetical protein